MGRLDFPKEASLSSIPTPAGSPKLTLGLNSSGGGVVSWKRWGRSHDGLCTQQGFSHCHLEFVTVVCRS